MASSSSSSSSSSSKNTTAHSAMDFLKAIFLHILRPKTAPCIALLSLLTVLFLTSLFAGHYPTSTTTTTSHLPPPPPPSLNTNLIKDFTLLKNSDGAQDLLQCDLFEGRWVVDESGPSYEPGSCPFVDVAFNCFRNGRLDLSYSMFRWQPDGCTLPRLDGVEMLEMLRGRRLAFVGDSLNRNMWQSLACILRNAVVNKGSVLEISGRREFRTDGFYSIQFADYNCSIEFFRSPFLVQEWRNSDENGSSKETLRLDVVHKSSEIYRDVDIIVFNTAHWWTHEKTALGKDFYQEGEHVYSQLSATEAYEKALSTWGKWVDKNIDSNRTQVFFRGYSISHFSGGQWNSGGNCHGEKLPITNSTQVGKYPKMMSILESITGEMFTPVHFLNITKMTDFRKDAHPSIFRQPAAERMPDALQDCSHWCLPGVPDAWNELLYVMLLRNANTDMKRS